MNLIHDVDPGTKEKINVIIEVPRHSHNKYEIDKKTGLIALDRAMHTSQNFPVDYGFVPQTMWYDDDPLDCIVLTTYPLHPGVIVRGRPVAIMRMIDDGDRDDKLITVPCDDPRWGHVHDVEDINPHTLKEIEHFYSTYKKIQGKVVEVRGIGNASEAREAFEEAREIFKKM